MTVVRIGGIMTRIIYTVLFAVIFVICFLTALAAIIGALLPESEEDGSMKSINRSALKIGQYERLITPMTVDDRKWM
jgi:hypothetical protein